ncbi:hypothetical protein BB559_003297 [Furculomyces boomerangus]|uniref:Glutamyl-tRNA(Gln) amidotransferase subunit C, mitochondrial n=2 Tax=Harpellales TaxID=61421 RepID=A0A2T9YM36_9FUNG|nr:hypothetical protein BB559_003297 [Furculomyces boomerangus]PWA00293.1 hypothetical protein BB558_003659 [Smittium angustum]
MFKAFCRKQITVRLFSTKSKSALIFANGPEWSVSDLLPKQNEKLDYFQQDDVQKLSKQSGLLHDKKTVEEMAGSINQLLYFINHIKNINTKDVVPLERLSPNLYIDYKENEADQKPINSEHIDRERALSNSKTTIDSFFVVEK